MSLEISINAEPEGGRTDLHLGKFERAERADMIDPLAQIKCHDMVSTGATQRVK